MKHTWEASGKINVNSSEITGAREEEEQRNNLSSEFFVEMDWFGQRLSIMSS
jgi:hypothetical protein